MKFCFVVGAMNLGGVQTFILNLSKHLVECQDEISVIAIYDKGIWWERLGENKIRGLPILRKDFTCPATHAAGIARVICEERFDVVFLNHVREAQIGIPLYSHVATVVPIVHNDTDGALELALRNQRHFHLIVGVSPRLIVKIRSRVGDERIVQLNYPVSIPIDTEFERRTSWQPTLRVVYVGRLHDEQKGIMILPDILGECKVRGAHVRLDVVGSGADRKRLEEALDRVGLIDSVTMHGPMSPEDVGQLLLQCHALLMPSHYEGLGIVAVEAQAAGCVPLATRLTGVTDHSIRNGETGFLVDGHCSDTYAARLAELASDQELWERMSVAGRAHAMRSFSIPECGAKFRSSIRHSRPIYRQRGFRKSVEFLRSVGWRDCVPNSLRTQPNL